MDTLNGKLGGVGGIGGTISGTGKLSARMTNPRMAPSYTGTYTVTPTRTTQILATAGYTLDEDITINPIPSNYGLITFSGGIITVS